MERSTARRFVLIVLLLALAFGAGMLLQERLEPARGGSKDEDQASTSQTTADPTASGTLAPARSAGPTNPGALGPSAAPPEAPLPPLDAPVAEIFEPLAARARAGDARAACRLAAELNRCRSAQRSSRFASDLERDLARRDESPQHEVDRVVRAETYAASASQRCEGVREDQLATTFDWQRQAALLDPARRVHFALAPALNPRDFLHDLERWAEYRSVALPWLEQAAREGDAAALIVLARIYGDHREHVMVPPPLRIRDDARFVLYAALADHVGVSFPVVNRSAAEARERLSPAEQAEIDAQIAEWRTRLAPIDDPAEAEVARGAAHRGFIEPADCGPSES